MAPLNQIYRRLLQAPVGLLYPLACEICQQPLDSDQPFALCAGCSGLLAAKRPACARCGMSLPDQPLPCPHCRRGKKYSFASIVRLGVYDDALRESVLRMKTAANEPLAAAVTSWMARHCEGLLREQAADCVVPVPMHWRRRWLHGTNSAETIADVLARELRLPLRRVLVRTRHTEPQGPLSPRQRRQNVKGVFAVGRFRRLRGCRILLVDDILTTGATCHEASKVLRKAGAAQVSVAVIARAEGL